MQNTTLNIQQYKFIYMYCLVINVKPKITCHVIKLFNHYYIPFFLSFKSALLMLLTRFRTSSLGPPCLVLNKLK